MKSIKPFPLLLLISLILLTRGFFFWETYIHSDEALFALSAKLWQNGGIPYVDFFENKPLGVYLFYSLASLFSGRFPDISIRSVHLFSLLWTLLTALTIQNIGRKVFSAPAGFFAAALFILFSSFWGPDIVAVHIEVILLLPGCLAMNFLLTAPEKLNAPRCFLSGFLATAAFLCKYQAGILFPIAGIYFLVILPRFLTSWRWKKALTSSLAYFLGLLPLPILMIFYLRQIGAWEGFYFWNFFGNFSYIQTGNSTGGIWNQMIPQIARYLGSTLLIWILSAVRFSRFWKERKTSPPSQVAQQWLIWVWFILTFLPVSTGKRFEDHYFLFLTPILSILAGAALVSLSDFQWRRWKIPLFLALLLPTLGFTATRYLMHPVYRRWGGEEMNAYRPYGEFLRAHSSPLDRLLVWGCAPAVYLYADRLPATRFLRTDNLAGRVAGLRQSGNPGLNYQDYITPGAWDLFWEDIRKHPPQYILDTAPTGMHDFFRWPVSQYPELKKFIGENYAQEVNFSSATVYRRLPSKF